MPLLLLLPLVFCRVGAADDEDVSSLCNDDDVTGDGDELVDEDDAREMVKPYGGDRKTTSCSQLPDDACFTHNGLGLARLSSLPLYLLLQSLLTARCG